MRAHRSAAACRVVRPLGLPAGGHLATGIFERNFPVNSRWIRFFRMAVLLLILWSGGAYAEPALRSRRTPRPAPQGREGTLDVRLRDSRG